MKQQILNRPKYFCSLEQAVEFYLGHSLARHRESLVKSVPSQFAQIGNKFYWKTDLLKTSSYWREWFTGLDKIFLDIQLPKLLILAEPGRLDKELTIAQMQGKFALKCPLERTGHHIHEDSPREIMNFILEFIRSFRIPLSREEINTKKNLGNF